MSNHRVSSVRLAGLAGSLLLAIARAAGAATPAADASAGGPGTYRYETLDYPGASQTILWGINDLGELSGQYALPGQPAHAMVYRHGRFEALDADGVLGAHFSAAGGPNDLGLLYGAYADASGAQHGFEIVWGEVQDVDFPGHLNSNVDGVNLFGAIAGVYWDADGVYHGMLRRYGRDTPIEVAGARDTYPLGIGNDGTIVGYWDTNSAQPRGFVRAPNGRYTTIDAPDALATVTFTTNDLGQIVGYSVDASGTFHGFVLSRGRFQPIDMPGAKGTFATTINNFGVVAGEYLDDSGARHGFVAAPW